MGIHFLLGNSQAPKGHAIFIARSTRDSRVVYSTYCLVPPIPMSLAKYLPPLFARDRSEEHTSELQSHLNLVCRLLLEKKKHKKLLNMIDVHCIQSRAATTSAS